MVLLSRNVLPLRGDPSLRTPAPSARCCSEITSQTKGRPPAWKVRQLAEALASDLQVHEHEEGVLQVNVVADAILQALEKSARSKAVLRKLLEELQLRAGHRRAEIEKGIRP